MLADGNFVIAGYGLDGASYLRLGADDGHVITARVLYEPTSYITEYKFGQVRVAPSGGV